MATHKRPAIGDPATSSPPRTKAAKMDPEAEELSRWQLYHKLSRAMVDVDSADGFFNTFQTHLVYRYTNSTPSTRDREPGSTTLSHHTGAGDGCRGECLPHHQRISVSFTRDVVAAFLWQWWQKSQRPLTTQRLILLGDFGRLVPAATIANVMAPYLATFGPVTGLSTPECHENTLLGVLFPGSFLSAFVDALVREYLFIRVQYTSFGREALLMGPTVATGILEGFSGRYSVVSPLPSIPSRIVVALTGPGMSGCFDKECAKRCGHKSVDTRYGTKFGYTDACIQYEYHHQGRLHRDRDLPAKQCYSVPLSESVLAEMATAFEKNEALSIHSQVGYSDFMSCNMTLVDAVMGSIPSRLIHESWWLNGSISRPSGGPAWISSQPLAPHDGGGMQPYETIYAIDGHWHRPVDQGPAVECKRYLYWENGYPLVKPRPSYTYEMYMTDGRFSRPVMAGPAIEVKEFKHREKKMRVIRSEYWVDGLREDGPNYSPSLEDLRDEKVPVRARYTSGVCKYTSTMPDSVRIPVKPDWEPHKVIGWVPGLVLTTSPPVSLSERYRNPPPLPRTIIGCSHWFLSRIPMDQIHGYQECRVTFSREEALGSSPISKCRRDLTPEAAAFRELLTDQCVVYEHTAVAADYEYE
jgi:hypothetical protein